MSIKDDMIEQHLIDTNTCFVCRKTMNENGECDVCKMTHQPMKLKQLI